MADDPTLQVLLHESEQVTKSIDRNITATYTINGVVIPAAVAVFGLAFNKDAPDSLRPWVLMAALATVFTLSNLQINYLWVDNVTFVKYKYQQIYPRLYALAKLRKENLGQCLASAERPFYLVHLFLVAFLGPFLVLASCAACMYMQDSVPVDYRWALRLYLLSLFLLSGVSALTMGAAIQKTMRELRSSAAPAPPA